MSTSTTCPKCGALNVQWAKFCASCGNPLAVTPQPQATTTTPQFQYGTQPLPPSPPPPWYAYSPPAAFEFRNRTEIDRTKTGLILLIIGTLLGPVPIITFIGGILALIGAILVILGRNAFGPKHARNAIWSIIIYIVSLGALAIGFVILFVSIFSATISARNGNGIDFVVLRQALASSFNTFLIATIIAGAIGGIAYVLFTYAIQNENGRIILWAAYISSLAITIINSILVSQTLSDAIQRSINGGTFDPTPIQNLQAQFQLFQLLALIPASLYATALYLVWSRIGRGELPAKPSTVPASPSPTMPPSTPPSPPPIQ